MLVAFFSFSASASAATIINTDVERQYSIKGDLVVVTETITFKNVGEKKTDFYELEIDPRERKYMNTLMASVNRLHSHNALKSLPITELKGKFSVKLPKALEPGDEQTLFVGYTLGQYLLFTTETITLKNLRIECFFNATVSFVSPYETKSSTLKIDGVSKNSITRMQSIEGLHQTASSIRIGPVTTRPANNEFFIEYSSLKALPYVTVINTTTSISHWGITKQESFIEAHNNGPKFVGEFNRIDFRESSNCYIQNIPVRPPNTSYSFWANDESGQLQRDIYMIKRDLDVPLRGPILPSWKATFTVGWTVKTSRFVTDNYIFTAPLFPKVFGDSGASVGYAHSEFIFPEGAIISKVNVPDAILATVVQTEQVCNLDFKGRKVVAIQAQRLSSSDEIPISIEYKIDNSFAFYKIAYLTFGFGISFLAIVIFRRIDLSIKHAKKE